MTRRDIPNLLTLLRILLMPFFLFVLLDKDYSTALILFGIAGISDGLDGLLAKHYGWTSRLGSILDPLADKLLLVGAFLSLTRMGLIPFWLTALVLGRDVLIILGAITYHFWVEHYPLTPVALSKLNTFIQIMLVLTVIIVENNRLIYFNDQIIQWLIYLTLVTTVLSGLHYIVLWSHRAIVKNHSTLRDRVVPTSKIYE